LSAIDRERRRTILQLALGRRDESAWWPFTYSGTVNRSSWRSRLVGDIRNRLGAGNFVPTITPCDDVT
jgi:hypothetical protein